MPNKPATQQQLVAENDDLRVRLAQAEASLREVRSDEVDALVVSDVGDVQLFAPANADQSFRILVGEMSEGALTNDGGGRDCVCQPALGRDAQDAARNGACRFRRSSVVGDPPEATPNSNGRFQTDQTTPMTSTI